MFVKVKEVLQQITLDLCNIVDCQQFLRGIIKYNVIYISGKDITLVWFDSKLFF